eukprot:scaffold361_cov248-Pinguiococcus_pyrenoidosus.AAC.1
MRHLRARLSASRCRCPSRSRELGTRASAGSAPSGSRGAGPGRTWPCSPRCRRRRSPPSRSGHLRRSPPRHYRGAGLAPRLRRSPERTRCPSWPEGCPTCFNGAGRAQERRCRTECGH